MFRLFIIFHYKPEEFSISIRIYDDKGKLIDSREYSGVKQIVFNNCRVIVSRHLKPEPLVIVVETIKPKIDFRENNLLYISSEG